MRKLPLVLLTLMLLVPLVTAGGAGAAGSFAHFVSGKVVDGAATPLAGVNVTATNVTTGAFYSTISNTSGEYNLSLPSGTYSITARSVNHTEAMLANQTIGPNNITDLNITLPEILGQLSGFVTLGNTPVAQVSVLLQGIQNYTAMSTAPLGHYLIIGIEPGSYLAKATKTGYDDNYIQLPIVISRGQPMGLNFTMNPQLANLTGTVSVNGAVEQGVSVTLRQNEQNIKQVFTDVNGSFSFTNILAGDYFLVMKRDGLVDKTVPVFIAHFEEKHLDVSMTRVPVEGLRGFIGDLDLTHSLMVIGLILALIFMTFALVLRSKANKNPDLLAADEEEEREFSREEAKKEERKHRKK